MKVSYRIVEEVTPEGEWMTVGIIVLWPEEPAHMRLRGMLQHTVSRPIWKTIRQRAEERQLTLETYQEALEEYSRFYRILPEIHHITADTTAVIRRKLREKYIFLGQPTISS